MHTHTHWSQEHWEKIHQNTSEQGEGFCWTTSSQQSAGLQTLVNVQTQTIKKEKKVQRLPVPLSPFPRNMDFLMLVYPSVRLARALTRHSVRKTHATSLRCRDVGWPDKNVPSPRFWLVRRESLPAGKQSGVQSEPQ